MKMINKCLSVSLSLSYFGQTATEYKWTESTTEAMEINSKTEAIWMTRQNSTNYKHNIQLVSSGRVQDPVRPN